MEDFEHIEDPPVMHGYTENDVTLAKELLSVAKTFDTNYNLDYRLKRATEKLKKENFSHANFNGVRAYIKAKQAYYQKELQKEIQRRHEERIEQSRIDNKTDRDRQHFLSIEEKDVDEHFPLR